MGRQPLNRCLHEFRDKARFVIGTSCEIGPEQQPFVSERSNGYAPVADAPGSHSQEQCKTVSLKQQVCSFLGLDKVLDFRWNDVVVRQYLLNAIMYRRVASDAKLIFLKLDDRFMEADLERYGEPIRRVLAMPSKRLDGGDVFSVSLIEH